MRVMSEAQLEIVQMLYNNFGKSSFIYRDVDPIVNRSDFMTLATKGALSYKTWKSGMF
jgi:hypothetical protein